MRTDLLASLTLLATLSVSLPAQDTTVAPEVSANEKMERLMKALTEADEAAREPALVKFIDGAVATSAVFAGQYAGLKQLDWDTTPVLMGWLASPPLNSSGGDQFRTACLNALRDTVAEAPEAMLDALDKMADDASLSGPVREGVVYAMAQFGRRDRADKMLEAAAAGVKSQDPNTRLGSLSQVANLHYNLRDYDKAAKSFAAFITELVKLAPNYQGLGTSIYNAACSHALAGETDKAFEYLEQALAAGTRLRRPLPRSLLETDMDIASLRGDERFAKIMAKHFPTAGSGLKSGGK